MSKNKQGGHTAKRLPTGKYPVGYCRPPQQHQFKKGVSGNPHGRRRQRRSQDDIAMEAMHRKVKVRNSTGERNVPAIEAAWMKVTEMALKGEMPAIKLMFDYYGRISSRSVPVFQNKEDQEILRAYMNRLLSETSNENIEADPEPASELPQQSTNAEPNRQTS